MGHIINYGVKFDYFDRYFVTFAWVADSAINGPFDITAYFIASAQTPMIYQKHLVESYRIMNLP